MFVDSGACRRDTDEQLARLSGLVFAARSTDDADVPPRPRAVSHALKRAPLRR